MNERRCKCGGWWVPESIGGTVVYKENSEGLRQYNVECTKCRTKTQVYRKDDFPPITFDDLYDQDPPRKAIPQRFFRELGELFKKYGIDVDGEKVSVRDYIRHRMPARGPLDMDVPISKWIWITGILDVRPTEEKK